MLMEQIEKGDMPDVTAHSSSQINSKINWVGMDRITFPCQIMGESVLARVNLYVNILDPSAKGIHMSRLYQIVHHLSDVADPSLADLDRVCQEMLESQPILPLPCHSTEEQLPFHLDLGLVYLDWVHLHQRI